MSRSFHWIAALTPDQWTAIGTVVTAIVAVFAAFFAWRQVRLARALREDQAKPFVVVAFRPSPVWGNAINLVVENIGTTLARNVRLTFDRPLESVARTGDINESKLFKEGIRVMPPGMRLATLFDLSHERVKSSLPMTYEAVVTYDREHGSPVKMEYTLDMGLFFGLEHFTEYGMHEAAKSLREMNKTLKDWTRSGRLKVSAYDEDYEDWADRWQYERAGKHPSLATRYPAGRPAPTKFDRLREPLLKRVWWPLRLRINRMQEHRGDRRLERIGRPDLVMARRRSRGE
jgi:hypothetical protein